MASEPKHFLTAAQYLEMERASEVRHEYYRGELFAMAGGSARHALIAMNLGAELRNRFKGRCAVVGSDLKLAIDPQSHYVYPDLMIFCDGLRLLDGTDDVALNPSVIIEVLSPSTESYDRSGKARAYHRLPSVREYIMVSQQQAIVERYHRHSESEWIYTLHEGLDATLPCLDCTVPLAEIYAGVDFDQVVSA